MRVELPLDGQEAFRIASFGLEYQPAYVAIHVDRHCAERRYWSYQPGDAWVAVEGATRPTAANLSAFQRFYRALGLR